jgi:putative thiamine transport system ATP-binding protein
MSLTVTIRTLAAAGVPLLQNLTLTVPPGVIHTVMGASGSGKSSLLAALCGTLPDGLTWNGAITLNDQRLEELPTERRRIGILFQDDLLYAHMTVRENLLFAVPASLPRAQREALVAQALVDVEMPAFARANPATLSGGQRARIALARALLAQPQALLLDEPFSKLDAPLRVRMRDLVFTLIRQRQIPALLVTHDPGDIADPGHLTQLT